MSVPVWMISSPVHSHSCIYFVFCPGTVVLAWRGEGGRDTHELKGKREDMLCMCIYLKVEDVTSVA